MLPPDDDAQRAFVVMRIAKQGVRRFLRVWIEALGLRRVLGGARRIFTNGDVVPPVLISTGVIVASVGVALALVGPPAPDRANGLTSDRLGSSGQRGMATAAAEHSAPLHLPAARTTPNPAPPSVASAPTLRPHEIFGFAPYWALDQSTGFDVNGLTTLAYFSLGVNPDGTIAESGPGWDGYQSQALADLISRAHAAGDRVVLTVGDFDQGSLDQLTSSPTAGATLGAALVQLVGAKNMDGVNLDLEGEGSADQDGLTNLVGQVSRALHAANPHYQVTMDTYASSAGDPGGFYNIQALAPEVDGFFVMAYELNLQSAPNPASPLTSSEFSTAETLKEYTAAVDPSKVVLGMGFYGEDWTTTDGTMAAQATGGPSTPSDADIASQGHPTYWDPVTDTAWTSFQENGVWHEQYFEDPSSLYLVAQMAQLYGVDGLGIWALGMDGNDPAMLSAMLGNAPAVKDSLAGPPSTSSSAGPPPAPDTTPAGAQAPGSTATTTAPGDAPSSSSTTSPSSSSTSPTTTPGSTTSTTAPKPLGSSTTTPTTSPSGTTTTTVLHETGLWQGTQVNLTPVAAGTPPPVGTPNYLGMLGDFSTNDPTYACLQPPPSPGPISTTTTTAPPVPPSQPNSNVLNVWSFGTNPTVYEVMANQPVDCVTATFTFPVPTTHPPDGSTTSSTTSSTTTTTTTTVSPTTEP